MKFSILYILLILSSSVYAQETDLLKEYLPGTSFTLDKNGRLISMPNTEGTFEIKSKEDKDKVTHTFIINDKSPLPTIWNGTKINYDLTVERLDGYVKRITRTTKNEKAKKPYTIWATNTPETSENYSLNKDGKVNSYTNCFVLNDYTLRKTSQCVTINKNLCTEMKSNPIDFNGAAQCGELFKKINEQLAKLNDITKSDFETNVKAISEQNGKFSKEHSVYNTVVDAPGDLMLMSDAMFQINSSCSILSDKFSEESESQPTEKKKSWWGKAKSGVSNNVRKLNMPFVHDKPNEAKEE